MTERLAKCRICKKMVQLFDGINQLQYYKARRKKSDSYGDVCWEDTERFKKMGRHSDLCCDDCLKEIRRRFHDN